MERGPSPNPFSAVRDAVTLPNVRHMILVFMMTGMAFGSVLVYQVPIMVGAGITLGTAGAIGGARGACQFIGRVGLTGLIARHGSRSLLLVAYAMSAVGVILLLVGHVVTALVFALLAGTGLGATSPLQAIYAREQFDEGDLGLLMGMQGAASGVAGGLGPFIGGLLRDWTDSWEPVVIFSTAALAVGALLLVSSERRVPS